MFVLELLGTLSLRADGRPVPPAAQQKRPLGLLALLALGGRQGLSRDRIESYFWPESPRALARHAFDQTVYAARHALGSEVIRSTGRELRLNADLFAVDLWTFEEAIRDRRWAVAVGAYKGALLDGAHLADSSELESWIDAERGRLLGEYQTAVESLADSAAEDGDRSQSVAWCRKLATSDPLSARATKKLMLTLAAAGDRAAAVKQARLYQELVRQQLEMEPDSEIQNLAFTFSLPATTESGVTTAPQLLPAVLPAPPLTAANGASNGARLSGSRPPHERSRIGAALSVTVLILLTIGAVTVENWRGREHAPSSPEATTPRSSTVQALPARDSYRRALDAWSDGSKQGLDSAVAYFRRATELDPEYAEAYAGLADAYVMLGYFGYAPRETMFPQAKAAALRSLQLDSTLASAHPALAYELTWERDFTGANSEFRKAIALDPTHPSAQAVAFDPTFAAAHQWYAILLMILGQQPETVVASRRELTHDPFALHAPVIEIPFTKWITTYPALAGFTSYGPGTIAGEILSRIDDGTTTHIIARYEVTDPNTGQSFKAVIQGKANDATGRYDLSGIVTWGWMTGAQLHVGFQRIAPCEFGKLNVCFQGIIQVHRG